MIQLSDHFNYKRLLRFTFPSIVMLVFTSIYGVVDGFFVSNYAGKTPFAAVNFIFPVLMILGCAGFMFGTGGSALIAKTLGEGAKEKANGVFSLLVYAAAACGAVLAAAGFALMPAIAAGLGAQGQLLEDSVRYGRIIVLALPFYILQSEFQCLFVTAEKPKLGLAVTVAAGSVNMALDALFVGVFRWGLEGAAVDGVFDAMRASPVEMIVWMAITVLGGFLVCSFKLQSGLERITKWMMLGLLGLIAVLAVHSLTLPGGLEGVKFYLLPDFQRAAEAGLGNVITAAMNQAFFTLSLGIAAMEIFGSYMSRDNTLTSEAVRICLLDTFVALMAGLIIFPACFSFGVEPDAGPSLIFITLPKVFANMAGGRLWGGCSSCS